MLHSRDLSFGALLLKTLLISAGGFLFVSLVADAAKTSASAPVIGPVSIVMIWLGMNGIRPRLLDARTHADDC